MQVDSQVEDRHHWLIYSVKCRSLPFVTKILSVRRYFLHADSITYEYSPTNSISSRTLIQKKLGIDTCDIHGMTYLPDPFFNLVLGKDSSQEKKLL